MNSYGNISTRVTALRQYTKVYQLVGKSDRAIRDMIVSLHSAILEEVRKR